MRFIANPLGGLKSYLAAAAIALGSTLAMSGTAVAQQPTEADLAAVCTELGRHSPERCLCIAAWFHAELTDEQFLFVYAAATGDRETMMSIPGFGDDDAEVVNQAMANMETACPV